MLILATLQIKSCQPRQSPGIEKSDREPYQPIWLSIRFVQSRELSRWLTRLNLKCCEYIHLFTALPRTLSISDLVEEMKKNSSKWIKTKGQKYDNFSWQKGYGAFSVSASQHNAVAAYIAKQKEHHKTQSYQEEYRKFLQLNQIPYDERYVWD
jgi:Transposase IS200 like